MEAQEEEAEGAAAQAEEVASTAMRAAESAVREEMEAAAVTKETKKALEKALADLQDLGISFAEVDERTASERAKVLEQNKVCTATYPTDPGFHLRSAGCLTASISPSAPQIEIWRGQISIDNVNLI